MKQVYKSNRLHIKKYLSIYGESEKYMGRRFFLNNGTKKSNRKQKKAYGITMQVNYNSRFIEFFSKKKINQNRLSQKYMEL